MTLLFEAPTIYSDDFDRFWKAYGRVPNASKADAQKAWTQVSPRLPPLQTLLRAVQTYISWVSEETQRRGKAYPKCHPATWLRQERWVSWLPADAGQAPTAPDLPPGPSDSWEKLRRDMGNDDMFFTWFKGADARHGMIMFDKEFKANWVRSHFMSKVIHAFGPDIEVRGPAKNN